MKNTKRSWKKTICEERTQEVMFDCSKSQESLILNFENYESFARRSVNFLRLSLWFCHPKGRVINYQGEGMEDFFI